MGLNKKALMDFPLIPFIIVVVMLLLVAPIILKVVTGTLTPFVTALNNTVPGGELAGQSVTHVKTVFVNFWDGVIVIGFLITILLLFVSAFLVDASLFFMVLYILMFLLTAMLAPAVMGIVDGIYDSGVYVNEVAQLGFLDFIRLNFGVILSVIGLLTMIIIYAKLRSSQR